MEERHAQEMNEGRTGPFKRPRIRSGQLAATDELVASPKSPRRAVESNMTHIRDEPTNHSKR